MPPYRSRCSVCRHTDAAEINAALELGFSYRWIRDRYGVALATLSRHVKHRRTESPAEEELQLESRLRRLEEEVALLRLAVAAELMAGNSRESRAELGHQQENGFPF